MADLTLEIAKEFTRTTRKRIPAAVMPAVAQIKAILDYPSGSRKPDIAFALLCDEDGQFHLLANRDVTEISWDIVDRTKRAFPPDTWVNPSPRTGRASGARRTAGSYVPRRRIRRLLQLRGRNLALVKGGGRQSSGGHHFAAADFISYKAVSNALRPGRISTCAPAETAGPSAQARQAEAQSVTILDRKDIEPLEADVEPVLDLLQGNIVKGHGRDHTVHLFFRFGKSASENRALIRTLANRVTSAAQQWRDTEKKYHLSNLSSLPFCNLFLTAKGYQALGYTRGQLEDAFPESRKPGSSGRQVGFLNGMAVYQSELHDPPLSAWEAGYANPTNLDKPQVLDGMVLLANDALQRLQIDERDIRKEMNGRAEILAAERGLALFNRARDQNLEHFGYVDGRSQPTFFLMDYEAEKNKKGGACEWDPREPLGRVLVQDVLAPAPDRMFSFGSYFVFRKLEQNVKAFKARENELADALGLHGPREELAGALAVGRFEDGTPVVVQPNDGLGTPVPNDFRFDKQDPAGLKCPFHAHIRKINPRGDGHHPDPVLSDEEQRSHRIARRGITYGFRAVQPKDSPKEEDLPEGGVGLLFMCFQASIENQFAYLQRRFANDCDFVSTRVGTDPLIGRTADGGACTQSWPLEWGKSGSKPFAFPSFVKLLGGEFFFAPSLAFLRGL